MVFGVIGETVPFLFHVFELHKYDLINMYDYANSTVIN